MCRIAYPSRQVLGWGCSMLLQRSRSRGGVRVEICHQIPGRTRLRVPTLVEAPGLEGRIAASLEAVDGVDRVRLNRACASLVLHHRSDFIPTRDLLKRTLTPILAPTPPVAPPKSKAARPSGKERPRPAARAKRAGGQPSASCPICQLKLRAARWILTDVWRCWRDYWAQRLHGRLVASLTLFRP